MVVDSKSHLHGACGAFKGKMVTIRVLGNVSVMAWCKILRLARISNVGMRKPIGESVMFFQ